MFFGLFSGNRHPCPSLRPEIEAIYSVPQTEMKAEYEIDGKKIKYIAVGTSSMKSPPATSTLRGVNLSIETHKIGEATNTEAVAHNKRVRECLTANGDF